MSRTFHLSVSVRGLLNQSDRELMRTMRSTTKDDGALYRSLAEFRNALMDELVAGNEVLPMSKECDNFDCKTGCKGHQAESAPQDKEQSP